MAHHRRKWTQIGLMVNIGVAQPALLGFFVSCRSITRHASRCRRRSGADVSIQQSRLGRYSRRPRMAMMVATRGTPRQSFADMAVAVAERNGLCKARWRPRD